MQNTYNRNYNMTRLVLNPEDLATVKSLLKKWVPNSVVMAYGSRVKDTCHAGSDLDLVIKNPINPDIPTAQLNDLKQSFSDSDLPILVDVMDWAYLPISYKNEINTLNVIIEF